MCVKNLRNVILILVYCDLQVSRRSKEHETQEKGRVS